MAGQWYVKGRDIHGPFTREQLSRLIREGRIQATTQLRNGNVGRWCPAQEVPGLFPSALKPPTATQVAGLSRTVFVSLVIGGSVVLSAALAVVICITVMRLGRPQGDSPTVDWLLVADSNRGELAVADATATHQVAVVAALQNGVGLPPREDQEETDIRSNPEPAQPAADVPLEAPAVEPHDEPAPLQPAPDPKPLIPPVPVIKLPIDDAEIVNFQRSVQREKKATDAYARYLVFSQSFEFTESQRTRIDAELAEWKARADDNLYRLGNKWVSRETVEAAEREADQLIDRSAAMIAVRSYGECVEFLERASRVNPNGIKADYILGLLYSLPLGLKAPEIAERHFTRVLQRSPDHPAALNSLAVAQLKQREYGAAITHFAKSAELLPACHEVAQNIGRAIMLAQSGRIRIESSSLRRYTDLYSKLIAEKRAQPFNERTGWLHMLPVFPAGEREEKRIQNQPAADDPMMLPQSCGSGFVIAPHFVLTNRHVVYSESDAFGIADKVTAQNEQIGAREISGSVVAISDESDLALLHFPELDAPPLALHERQLPLATEVMILGYPRTDVFGTKLKATRGVVSALPDPARDFEPDHYLLDAISDHGNSGGPVIDMTGTVVCVLTGGIGLKHRVVLDVEAEFGSGVPSDRAVAFARLHIKGFPAPQDAVVAEPAQREWSKTVADASSSVVRVTTFFRAGIAAFDIAGEPHASTGFAWHDYTCPNCNGRSRLACPAKGCIGGQISVPYYVDEVIGSAGMYQIVRHKRFRKERCSTCMGGGTVDCPGCVDGWDSFLGR